MHDELSKRITRFKQEYGATNLLISKVSGVSARTLAGHSGMFWRPSEKTVRAIHKGLDRLERIIRKASE